MEVAARPGQPAIRYEAVSWSPSVERLGAYEGTYRSPELGATYEIRLVRDRLVLRRRHFPVQALKPVFEHFFLLPWGWDPEQPWYCDAVFDMSGGKRARGFELSTGRANGLWFDRIQGA